MSDTPISLLERLQVRSDSHAWQRLMDVYEPMLRGWLRGYAFQPADVDDVVQEICAVLVRELPRFRHDGRQGAFRRWLHGMLVNRLRVFWRERRKRGVNGVDISEDFFNQLEDPQSSLSRLWEAQHDKHVAHRLLRTLQPEFEESTWRAFSMLVFEGKPAADVAEELGLSVNAVRLAKSRVLRRLRQESAGLID